MWPTVALRAVLRSYVAIMIHGGPSEVQYATPSIPMSPGEWICPVPSPSAIRLALRQDRLPRFMRTPVDAANGRSVFSSLSGLTFAPRPARPAAMHRSFAPREDVRSITVFENGQIPMSVPNRLIFAGHYHCWLLVKPDGIAEWEGQCPVRPAPGPLLRSRGFVAEADFGHTKVQMVFDLISSFLRDVRTSARSHH